MIALSNKDVVNAFFNDLWNGRRLDAADELFSADCLTHQLRSGQPDEAVVRGPDVMRHHVSEWLTAFPDLRFEVEEMIEEGSLVTTRCVMRGTHRGVWVGIEPTEKPVVPSPLRSFRFRRGG